METSTKSVNAEASVTAASSRSGPKRKVTATGSSATGRALEVEIETAPEGVPEFMRHLSLDDATIRRMIERLNVSADAKARLYSLSKLSALVGEATFRVGRKILDLVFGLCRQFPQAAFGTVLGAIAGALVGAIPVLGWVLGPVLTPILAALGLVAGFVLDFKDKMLMQAIDARVAKIAPIPRGKSR